MNNKKFIEFITSVPFVIVVILVVTLVSFWIYIYPQHNYVANSTVLTKDSYLKVSSSGNLRFFINVNLFPEIKKESSFQKDIPQVELQRALLRKELKLLKNFQQNPKDKQVLFDLSMWYIITSGIKSNLNQLKEDRAARLVAGYYYLKKFNGLEPTNKETQKLTELIHMYLIKEIKDNRKFYNSITLKPSKNLEEPPAPDEIYQQELLDKTYTEKDQLKNLENLCKYYKEKASKSDGLPEFAYSMAAQACYQELK